MSNRKNLNPLIATYCNKLQALLNKHKVDKSKNYTVSFTGVVVTIEETIRNNKNYRKVKNYSYPSKNSLFKELVRIVPTIRDTVSEYKCIKN